uniref:RRM domain-containing protein n=1 Tax=Aegilops tauschii subsp. strangulata TaxID=200361 RepID=A0A453BBX5_AEGTS
QIGLALFGNRHKRKPFRRKHAKPPFASAPSQRRFRHRLIETSYMAAVAAARAGAARAGFRRMFSVSAFAPPPPPTARPAAEPCNNLFVSGLNKRTTSDGLREAFSKFGQVTDARVITDRISGYSRGFGFVRYATVEEAGEGIKGMDGKVSRYIDQIMHYLDGSWT